MTSSRLPTIRNIVFTGPEPAEELGTFWAHLLGWQVVRHDWFVVAPALDVFPRLAFDGLEDYRPPRWPDPEYPQQLHLDIAVPDVDGISRLALSMGATSLRDERGFAIFADPAGHPFCVYEPGSEIVAPEITHIVYDCFSPRSLARFYEELLGMTREHDSPEGVTIGSRGGVAPKLSFQHAVFPAVRWPDPAYPQQLHLDFFCDDAESVARRAVQLGAIAMPSMGGSCPVFADPAAHPFCICGPNG